LSDPKADLTVFAPTDAAFLRLAQTLGYTGMSETGVFNYLVEGLTLLSGGTDPVPLMTDILLYHVAPGSLFASDLLVSNTTLLGANVGVAGTMLVDGDPDLTDPKSLPSMCRRRTALSMCSTEFSFRWTLFRLMDQTMWSS
jgi:serralysin